MSIMDTVGGVMSIMNGYKLLVDNNYKSCMHLVAISNFFLL